MVLATRGPRRVAHANNQNVGESERAVSAAIGGLLIGAGVKKRGVGGLALAFVGAELVRRAATGHCMLYEVIGFSSDTGGFDDPASGRARRSDVRGAAATVNARKAIKIERSISINRPAADIYDFWRDFRNIPQVMEQLVSVTDMGGGRSRWIARGPANVRVEWDSEIVNDIPGELIAWKTIGESDVAHAGSVHFTPAGDGSGTTVRFVMDYEPPGGRLSAIAAKLIGESPDEQVRSDLERLKELLETASMSS